MNGVVRYQFLACLLILGVASPLRAQVDAELGQSLTGSLAAVVADVGRVVTQPEGPAPTPRHTGIKALIKDLGQDVIHLPSKENLFWVGVGGGLALAVHPADDNVNEAWVNSDFAHDFFAPGKYMGSLPVLLGAATATYIVGRSRDQPRVSHVGMDLIQALAISEFITQSLKHITNRERPDQSNNTSFPSGHAADTFAFATALERHLGWKGAVPAYILSSYVAISRLPANRHWLSDAVFGSAVGIIAGRTVTRHGRDFPVTVAPVPGGAAIVYLHRPRATHESRHLVAETHGR
jgi:PAP2 superfamily protein